MLKNKLLLLLPTILVFVLPFVSVSCGWISNETFKTTQNNNATSNLYVFEEVLDKINYQKILNEDLEGDREKMTLVNITKEIFNEKPLLDYYESMYKIGNITFEELEKFYMEFQMATLDETKYIFENGIFWRLRYNANSKLNSITFDDENDQAIIKIYAMNFFAFYKKESLPITSSSKDIEIILDEAANSFLFEDNPNYKDTTKTFNFWWIKMSKVVPLNTR